ncbi:MAG: hypothetical protein DRI74_02340 [Bacteroidetes bacterium]|nr:MAG: hypothetical protein DRI74_02340 [Bacteroidota bacterium]
MKYTTLIILFLFQTYFLSAQNIPLGHWRDELPYSQLTSITESEDFVYAATPYSILSFHKKEAVLDRISKVNGLNDFGISTIRYNPEYKTLFIAYTNANIDLIKNGEIVNLSDIKRKTILGNKTINDIFFINQFAYLSCGFGIVVVDIEREEIKDTYYVGENGENVEVFDLDVLDGEFFAATENGIYRANIDNPNLANFNNWIKLTHLPFQDAPYNHIVAFQDKLIVNRFTNSSKDQMFAITSNSWKEMISPINDKVLNLDVSNDKLLCSHKYSLGIFNSDFSFDRKIYTYGEGFEITLQPNAVLTSSDGNYYIADRAQGLVSSPDLQHFQSHILNGPRTTKVFDMSVVGSKVVVAAGGRTDSYGNVYMKDGIFTYTDGFWTNYYKGNVPALDTAYDFVCVDINPNNPNEYAVGTWGKGLYTFDENGFVEAYGRHNSSLTPNSIYSHIMRLGGVAYDSKNNLWVASAESNALLHKREPSGEWTPFEFGAWSSYNIKDMLADNRDYLWMSVRIGGVYSLLVFDESRSTGQQLKGLSTAVGSGNIPGTMVLSLACDLDGEMWIGTDKGIGVIYQAENIFYGGDYDAQKIIVERDGYAQYLLDKEKVKTIAVDGANRKWIGTERAGVFLLSADGQEELLHFTTENSPLYSDNITQIGINDDGEVYIGTDQGLIVYKGTATKGEEENIFADVYAYPNPVRPDYVGPIAIKGLSRDAFIKITDISGRLVNEIRSDGGQAIWSGNNLQGDRVQTGIYLVFIANTDGSESIVTKIMFIH